MKMVIAGISMTAILQQHSELSIPCKAVTHITSSMIMQKESGLVFIGKGCLLLEPVTENFLALIAVHTLLHPAKIGSVCSATHNKMGRGASCFDIFMIRANGSVMK
jgi:hypothetical protein